MRRPRWGRRPAAAGGPAGGPPPGPAGAAGAARATTRAAADSELSRPGARRRALARRWVNHSASSPWPGPARGGDHDDDHRGGDHDDGYSGGAAVTCQCNGGRRGGAAAPRRRGRRRSAGDSACQCGQCRHWRPPTRRWSPGRGPTVTVSASDTGSMISSGCH